MRAEGKVLHNRCKALPRFIDRRVPFDTTCSPGLAAYVQDCRAHSAPLSYRGERIWRQRWRGTVRIEDPDLSRAKIVD